MLDVGRSVLGLDPYADRLSARARAERAVRALAIARERFNRCKSAWAGDERLALKLDQLELRLTAAEQRKVAALEHDSDLFDDSVAVAFEIEKLPAGACGADAVGDRALDILASRHAALIQ
jgi:aminopeptidase N